MIKELPRQKLAEYTGYTETVFHQWLNGIKVKGEYKKKPSTETKQRYEALQLGAVLLQEGHNIKTINNILVKVNELTRTIIEKDEKIKALEEKYKNLEKEIHKAVDQIEKR